MSGKPMVQRATIQYQVANLGLSAFLKRTRCGTSSSPVRRPGGSMNFFRVSQSPSTPMPREAMPKPIIQRKPQYATGMLGR